MRKSNPLLRELRKTLKEVGQIEAAIDTQFPGLLHLLKQRAKAVKKLRTLRIQLDNYMLDQELSDPWGNS